MRVFNALLAAIVTASISLTPIMTSGAFAESGYRNGGASQGQGRIMDKLNLTADQKQQMQTIHKDTQAKMKPLRQELRQAQQERKSLIDSNASTQQLQGNFDKIQDIKKRIAQVEFDRMTAMRNVLTPEQRAQMTKLMQERKGNRGNRGQNQGNRSQNRPQSQGNINIDS